MCGVAQHTEDTPDKVLTPADAMAAVQNEEVVYVPDYNYRNPSQEVKHQQDLLKDYFNHLGALAGQEDRILDVSGNYCRDRRSWHLSVLFRTTHLFQELIFKLLLHKFPKDFPKTSNRFPPSFPTISN